jgi:hypothetical protein
MEAMSNEQEQLILEKVRMFPPEWIQKVLDFVECLEQQGRQNGWIEFDEWALNLTKETGFQHLTEEDVARIVKEHRPQRISTKAGLFSSLNGSKVCYHLHGGAIVWLRVSNTSRL